MLWQKTTALTPNAIAKWSLAKLFSRTTNITAANTAPMAKLPPRRNVSAATQTAADTGSRTRFRHPTGLQSNSILCLENGFVVFRAGGIQL